MNLRTTLRPRRKAAVSLTPAELLARMGRVALWLAVAVVLARELAGIAASARPAHDSSEPRPALTWPDDAARAFAIQFATAYLGHADGHDPLAAARELAQFAPRELVTGLAPQLDGHGPRRTVGGIAIADVTRLDRMRALITVVASLLGDASRVVRLTIPIARDQQGGLVVYDLPSVAPALRLGRVAASQTEPLTGSDRDAIFDVLERFFRAYLAGDSGALTYFVPAGTRLDAAEGGFELADVVSIAAVGEPERGGRAVLATIEVRDRASRAVLGLRYRVRVVHRDRWYVAAVNDARTGGEGG